MGRLQILALCDPVITRTLIGLLVTCLLAALVWFALAATNPAVKTAHSLLGERWYRLTLAGAGVGYYRSQALRGPQGEHEFHTELRFALVKEQPVTVLESYVFRAKAPYDLVRARHSVERTSGTATVNIKRQASGLFAQRSDSYAEGGPNAEASSQLPVSRSLDWRYTLEEYLAFETWIRRQAPGPGASINIVSPNLDTLSLAKEAFELVSVDANGYRVRKRSLLDDTLIDLDRDLIPQRFELAGVFSLQRSSQEEALGARTPLLKASYRLPLDEALPRPAQLRRLVMRVRGRDAHELGDTLALSDNPLVAATAESYLGVSIDYPVDHPRLQESVAKLGLAQLDPSAQVDRLVRHVHDFLTYDDSVNSPQVLELLDKPRGDCTEFADLFTSLARAAGLPARTIIGMAYSDDPAPALAFHAWNQVQVNGTWEVVDPTWNQRQVDATHWPLPSSERQAMLLLTGQLDVQLQVVQTDYGLNSAIPAG